MQSQISARSRPVPEAAQPEGLQRALAYMRAHLDASIDLHDIAQAAGTSPRAVQYAFREHLGTTPLAHLRLLRLARVRQELLGATPDTTISGVATRWGFFHLGRFAAAYREVYGERPRDTLERRG